MSHKETRPHLANSPIARKRAPALLLFLILVAFIGFVLMAISNPSARQSTEIKSPASNSHIYETPPAPSITQGSDVSSVTDCALLNALYGPTKNMFDGKASVVHSMDFNQHGTRKRIFISNLSLTDKSHEYLSAHVFAWIDGKWRTEKSYSRLDKIVEHWPKSDLRWLQVGRDNFALQESGAFADDDSGRNFYLSLIDISSKQARSIMSISQSTEKGEAVSINLAFEKSQKPLWTAFVKTTFNKEKRLVVRYISEEGKYVAAGTVPPLTVEKAMTTRGVPPADWE